VASSLAVPFGNSPEIQEKIPRKSLSSVYDIVTERVLAELEKGEIPWRKPWRTLPPANLGRG
jgi:antirestriction protein ArdC